MNPNKEFLKEYLEDEAPAEILNDSFLNVLPVGKVIIDSVNHDCVGGVRLGVSVTEEGGDFAEEFQVKIMFLDLIIYINRKVEKCNTQQ